MKLKNKTILLISPEPWGINHVSKHHYAIELAKKGNDVYFLNPPSTRFNIRREKKGLFIYDYKPTYKGLAKMPALISAWLIKKEIKKLENICNATFDIIWNFDSSSFFNLKLLKSKLIISHIVDFNQNKNIKLINQHANLCLATSKFILKRQKKYNSNAFNIGHGYAVSKTTIPIKLPKTNKNIKVGYVGNLLIKYLDWELIYKLVTENPEIYFYFAGPYEKSNMSSNKGKPYFLGQTINKENTSFLGSIPSSKINSFLSQMDILLLAYKTQGFKEQLANPHKIMEYLGSGKSTIATWTEEFKDSELIVLATDKNHYVEIFNRTISNIVNSNSKVAVLARIDFAKKNSYSKRVEEIERLISNNG